MTPLSGSSPLTTSSSTVVVELTLEEE
jgi:hypothetical protein